MRHRSATLAMVCFFNGATAADSIPTLVLECDGTKQTTGIDLPDNIKRVVPLPAPVAYVHEIRGNLIESRSSDDWPGISLALCQKAASKFIFASNCQIDPIDYRNDWTSEDDHTEYHKTNAELEQPSSKFFAKYPRSHSVLRYVVVDLAALTVTDQEFVPRITSWNQKHGFMRITTISSRCTLGPRVNE